MQYSLLLSSVQSAAWSRKIPRQYCCARVHRSGLSKGSRANVHRAVLGTAQRARRAVPGIA
eukprot:93161-Rhodomonas_salina.2